MRQVKRETGTVVLCGMVLRAVMVLLPLTLTVASCTKKPTQAPTQPAGGDSATKSGTGLVGSGLTKSAPYKVVEVAHPGQLEVQAFYASRPIPEQGKVPVNVNVDTCGDKVYTEDVIADKDTGALKNVVVRLEGISEGGREVPDKVTVSNKDCAFVPHVTTAVKGTRLQVTNEDPILHTTHPTLNNRSVFNAPLSPGGAPPPLRPLKQAGTMEINCDVHKWMRGYTIIHQSPYIEVTDENGKLVIDKIPPGEHAYVAWHERLGEKRGTVKIEPDGTASLKLDFDLAQ